MSAGRDVCPRTEQRLAAIGLSSIQFNVNFEDTCYEQRPGYGHVHHGFQQIYHLVGESLSANLPAACEGCTQLLLTGHSLGAALAVLAAPAPFEYAVIGSDGAS